MFTAPFWRAAGERAIRTVAQTLLALWLVGDLAFNALAVDWGEALGVALGAGIISLLTSLAAERVNPATGPSLGTEKPLPPGGARKRPADVGPPRGEGGYMTLLGASRDRSLPGKARIRARRGQERP